MSLSAVFGGSMFWLYERAAAGSLPETLTSTLRLLRVTTWFAAVSGVLWLAGTIANVTGGFANIVDPDMLHVFIFETPFGTIWTIRLALLGALVVSAILPLTPRQYLTANTFLGATLLSSQAWLGHAVEGGTDFRGVTMLAAYSGHVLGAAAWVGSLPILAFALAERQRHNSDCFDLLARYSTMATVSVALIVISGIANTMFHVGDFGQLAGSTYGVVLFTKLTLVAVMVALAAINRFVLMPRLCDQKHNIWHRMIRMSVVCELGLAISVIGAAAILGITPPPH